ncbi:MAG: hypothetical protein JWM47_2360 [Acidimicrobiales bacterium]|nr:hypothetical protein [Acidimicrobiales bacterium]
MVTRGDLVSHAREHAGVIAVVVVTVLGVLVAGTFADASPSDIDVGAPAVEVTVPSPAAATPGPAATVAPPAGLFVPAGPLAPITGTVTTPTVAPTPSAGQAPPAAKGQAPSDPIVQLPPLGDLSSADAAIRSLCSAILTPFGLYATVFGLVGGTIPFTLPELPFYILVGPISDACLQLEGLTP